MKQVLLTLWQLPQCIIGWVLLLFVKPYSARTDYQGGVKLTFSDKMSGGISLGTNIILASHYMQDEKTVKHEYGHTRQSLYLGWLYLIVIGLPSILWAAFYNGDEAGYYKFYTEAWADRLGGVER